MEADFPAAHSMDTTWFAIDGQGHVAQFHSGEDGHVPEDAAVEEESLDQDPLAELWALRHGADSSGGRPEELYGTEAAARLGLFIYDYNEGYDLVGPYSRRAAPEQPLHVDQLPPHLRQLFKQVRLKAVRFAEAERVQPLEQYACFFWDEDRVAYLCADGVTVRPIPGKEDRFDEFCEDFRAANPDEAARLRFVRPGEGAGD
jgi:hypothetical protein